MNTTTTTTYSSARGWLGVSAITASLFVFLTTELMPVGILTPIAGTMGVSVGAAGLMVTLYGISAGLGVPFVVAWTRRVDRRVMLLVLLAVLVAGNLVTAIAPSYPLVLASRLVMGFANGAFWAIGVAMAVRLVPDRLAGRAAAVVMSGISIAIVVGIPLGSLLENLLDWRTTFLIWAGLSGLVLLAVAALVPSLPSQNAVPVKEVLLLPFQNPRLRAVMVIVVLFVLGHFGAFTFIRPYLESNPSVLPEAITGLLVMYGVGGATGNFVAGHTVSRSLRGSFVAGGVALVAALVLLLAIGRGEVSLLIVSAVLILWGVAFGVVQICQLNMTREAAPDTFEAAMSLNTLAYNSSIALGALFGGLVADGIGVHGPLWFGALLVTGSLLVLLSARTAAAPSGASPRAHAGATS